MLQLCSPLPQLNYCRSELYSPFGPNTGSTQWSCHLCQTLPTRYHHIFLHYKYYLIHLFLHYLCLCFFCKIISLWLFFIWFLIWSDFSNPSSHTLHAYTCSPSTISIWNKSSIQERTQATSCKLISALEDSTVSCGCLVLICFFSDTSVFQHNHIFHTWTPQQLSLHEFL